LFGKILTANPTIHSTTDPTRQTTSISQHNNTFLFHETIFHSFIDNMAARAEHAFEDICGDAKAEVDFARPAVQGWEPLKIPAKGDSLTVMARKMEALAKVVEQGKSVAVWTGFTGAVAQTRGQEVLTEMEVAEVHTIGEAVNIAAAKVSEVFAELKKLSRSINAAKVTLQAREHALKRKLPDYRPHNAPTNDPRPFVGLPNLGVDVDFRAGVGGGREERENLLPGTGLTAAGRATYVEHRRNAGPAPPREPPAEESPLTDIMTLDQMVAAFKEGAASTAKGWCTRTVNNAANQAEAAAAIRLRVQRMGWAGARASSGATPEE
jgi:hypothetical protein